MGEVDTFNHFLRYKTKGWETSWLSFFFCFKKIFYFLLLTGCVLYTQCNYLSSKYHHSVEWSCHMKNRFGTIVAYCWKIIINFLFSSKKKFHNDTDEFCCFSSNTSTHFKPISVQSPWSVTLMVEIFLWDRTLHPKYDLAGLAPCGHCRVPWPTPTTTLLSASAPEGPPHNPRCGPCEFRLSWPLFEFWITWTSLQTFKWLQIHMSIYSISLADLAQPRGFRCCLSATQIYFFSPDL